MISDWGWLEKGFGISFERIPWYLKNTCAAVLSKELHCTLLPPNPPASAKESVRPATNAIPVQGAIKISNICVKSRKAAGLFRFPKLTPNP